MIQGIILAITAGIMLGFYALPEKFTKDYKYENTWGLFFLIALFIIPILAGLLIIDDFGAVLSLIPSRVLIEMIIAGFLWGFGVQLWSKAINYIGVSLGFSIFIGAVILIGSLLPFIVDGLPASKSLTFILIGLVLMLFGVIANGKAGMLRQKSENADKTIKKDTNISKGIIIALVGGVLATGFSYANAIGVSHFSQAMVTYGNPEWKTALALMIIIYLAGALYVLPYFCIQLSKNKSWHVFKTKHFTRNISLATIMAVLNFAASALFAHSAYLLGAAGNTVGYAIYNTVSVLIAVISGLATKEWIKASNKARANLYFALVSMIVGVILIALGNSFNIG